MHDDKKSFSQRAEEFLNGKGFYIVLFVCIAVIGVSAWLLMFSEFSPLDLKVDEGDYVPTMGSGESEPPIEIKDDTAQKPPAVTTKPAETETPADDTLTLVPDPAETKPEQKPEQKPETKPAPAPAQPAEQKPETKPTESARTLADITFIWPLAGSISVPYSPAALIYDRTMGDWRTHDGVDLAAPIGTKVLTVADGTVKELVDDVFYGTTVVIDHGAGVESRYSNLTAVPTVKAGDSVTMGSVIGAVGDTALCETGEVTHLHFMLTINGESADPSELLPKR